MSGSLTFEPVSYRCVALIGRKGSVRRPCDRPAVELVWGKLFRPDELGPRCSIHVPERGGFMSGNVASLSLRGLYRRSESS